MSEDTPVHHVTTSHHSTLRDGLWFNGVALLRFWRASLAAEMEYRLNFLMAALTSIGSFVGGLFLLSLFFRDDKESFGWSFAMACAVLGAFTLCSGFSRSVLTPNLSRIVNHVEHGTLDYFLLHPMDAQLQLSFRQVSIWGIPDVFLGAGLLGYAAWHTHPSFSDVMLASFSMGCGLVILYGLWFSLASLSIWFVRVYNAAEVLRSLLEAGRLPLELYPTAWRIFLTYVVPVAFMTSVPAAAFVGRGSFAFVGGSLVAAMICAVGSRLIWKLALRHYSSASS
ncbi:MAG: ABC transporter permease [Deltaproteobacteria bacterium]|nr:ABC transporter permease [Deltaproteobacteria bacterium]